MLIKSVRELKRFPHLGGGFTSQYAPVGWEFAKICNDVKSNPHLGPGWGRVGVSIDKCISQPKTDKYHLVIFLNFPFCSSFQESIMI